MSGSALGLDVVNQGQVFDFFQKEKPEYVFLSSPRSGGIQANIQFAAEFSYYNLMGQCNIIHAAFSNEAKKLLYYGSSCVYPKESPQPIQEKDWMSGPLEETSEPYAIAKMAGIKMCQAYRTQYGFNAIVMIPATIYGPGCEINLQMAHVLESLVGKFAMAKAKDEKEVVVWGTGQPRREFLYVGDFTKASEFLMDHYNEKDMINAGCGSDISIKELAEMIAGVADYQGQIIFDDTKPDGAPKKLLDNSRIRQLGWEPRQDLREGIEKTFEWYKDLFTSEREK
ncbi:MAG: GDP-L-fucose synthase [Candidatus Omnitrophica bacterium]|nr:GDP-L-fucose synthase [Candidatus Omnitrophota bacterium]